MTRLRVLGALAGLGALLLLMRILARGDLVPGHGPPERADAPTAHARHERSGGTGAMPGRAPASPSGQASPVESGAGLTESERSGPFRALVDQLAHEGVDPAVTAEQLRWARAKMAEVPVVSRRLRLSCSPSLCRADFVFESVERARDLARILLPSEFSRRATDLEPSDDGYIRVVVYWGVGGVDVGHWLGE